MRTLIIEDDEKQQDRLESLLNEHFPDFEVVAKIASVNRGLDFLKQNEIDLAILDVEIKGGTSFDILSQLETMTFHIVFITSFTDYAIQAFRQSAVDYLLKPMDSEEFVQAIEKVSKLERDEQRLNKYELLTSNFQNPLSKRRIALPDATGYTFIDPSNILYCESENTYTTLFLESGRTLLISKTLKIVEEVLHGMGFFRVHNRALINMAYVEKYDKSEGGFVVMGDGKEIPISRRRRESFVMAIQQG